ncbi:hypothetical protein MPSEU_000866200 [Mayamaea pseudoterrestris]|nr:hypothetical protein MPSEU_000866200 [Mayamaea pseudoterrestris]
MVHVEAPPVATQYEDLVEQLHQVPQGAAQVLKKFCQGYGARLALNDTINGHVIWLPKQFAGVTQSFGSMTSQLSQGFVDLRNHMSTVSSNNTNALNQAIANLREVIAANTNNANINGAVTFPNLLQQLNLQQTAFNHCQGQCHGYDQVSSASQQVSAISGQPGHVTSTTTSINMALSWLVKSTAKNLQPFLRSSQPFKML